MMDLSPPPPPPPPPLPPPSPPLLHLPHPGNNSFPVIAIAVIGILATAFLLISYYIFVIKCCLTWHRVDIFNRFFSRVRDPTNDVHSSATPTLLSSPDTAVQKGLDEAVIRSIPVIEFRKLKTERKHETVISASESAASYECAVCLCEFEEGERLRVIPNCCHAFHIDCIDVWLQSNANCPLCRSGISPASILYNTQQHFIHFPPSFQPQKSENDNGSDNDNDDDDDEEDDDDFVVIEIQGNNLDEPGLVSRGGSEEKRKERKKLGRVCSMGDEFIDIRKKDEEFEVVPPVRRSISMDLSKEREYCFEIRECCRSNMEGTEVSCGGSSSSSSSNSSKVRRSIFSFGYGRSSRCSVQPVYLDP